MPRPESEPQITQYSEVATHEIHEVSVDEAPEIDFGKSDIAKLYVSPPEGLGFSGPIIATVIDRTAKTVYNRLRKQGIELRPVLKDPALEQKRREGLRRIWSEQREEIVPKIHTPDSDARRSERMKELLAQDPAYADTMLSRLPQMRRIQTQNRRQRKEESLRVKHTLTTQENIARARAILEHPGFRLLSQRQQSLLVFRYRTDGQPPRSLREASQFIDNLSKPRAWQIEQQALDRLRMEEERLMGYLGMFRKVE